MIRGSKQETESPPGYKEDYRQTSYRRLRWDWAEASIWTDNMLAALENGVKGGKWFSLIDKVWRLQTLESAWLKVRSNKGAAGVDNITIMRFEANKDTYLKELSEQLRAGSYQPIPVKRVYIDKGPKEKRPLGIPAVKDRVVQMALKMVIEPIFENEFMQTSFGFRPKRGTKDALREVDILLKSGYTHAVDVDFKSYFDTIPHKRLMEEVEVRIGDGRILKLIRKFLEQEIMEGMKKWQPMGGTPQGAVISPLLANIYLHPLDVLINQHMKVPMIRYADDFIIMTESPEQAQKAMRIVQEWASMMELTVHPQKSRIISYEDGEGIEFLGYEFRKGWKFVRKKSLQKFRDKVKKKTLRTCGKSLEEVVESLNSSLRGWYNYFKHAHRNTFKALDGFVRRRLRAMLRKRDKRPGFGRCLNDSKQWPNSFFAKAGLFCLDDARRQEVTSYQPAGAR